MRKSQILFVLMFVLVLPTLNAGALVASAAPDATSISEVQSTDYLSIEQTTVKAGDSLLIPVQLTNVKELTAFQCDIYIPEGLSVLFNEEEGEYDIRLEPSRITSSHSITAQDQPDGSIRLACYSSKSKDFKGTSGTLFYVHLAAHERASGEYNIGIKNVIFSTSGLESVEMSDVDGKVNVLPLVNEMFATDTIASDCYSLLLPVNLSNESSISAFQCDVYLPEGVSLAKNSDEEYDVILESSRCTSSHTISAQEQTDGAIRLVCYSSKSKDFRGDSGTLFYLNLQVEKSFVGKELVIGLKNVIASSSDLLSYEMKDSQSTVTFVLNSYKLTYMVDELEYKSENIVFDSKITAEEEPTKEGYTFSGWSEIPETMPAHDVIITGTFIPNTYKVTYIIEADTFAIDYVAYGTPIICPDAQEKEGHTFTGWMEVPETMPAHDITVYGSYTVNSYTITYMIDGKVYAEDSLAYGTAIIPIDGPTVEGYTFNGWSEIPETMPAHDVIITGTFIPNTYKVTYIIEADTFAIDYVAYGTPIICPDAQEKEGHTFTGWMEVPETMPAHDITVYGNYTINSYTITYMIDGEVYAEDTLAYGTAIVPIDGPTVEGYIFSGWSEVPGTMPAHDVVVTGTLISDGVPSITGISRVDVYGIDGVLVKKHVQLEELKQCLPQGLYIINGQKVYIMK